MIVVIVITMVVIMIVVVVVVITIVMIITMIVIIAATINSNHNDRRGVGLLVHGNFTGGQVKERLASQLNMIITIIISSSSILLYYTLHTLHNILYNLYYILYTPQEFRDFLAFRGGAAYRVQACDRCRLVSSMMIMLSFILLLVV